MKRSTDGMLTRRQLLEAAALGLTGCLAAGCSRPGHGHALSGAAERATGLRVAAGTDTINATNAAAGATALATRLEPPPYHKPVVASFPQCWRPGDLILQGDRTGPRTVAITSDDGPWPHNTVAMMNHMRDAGLEANGGLVQFFMVGNNVVNFADVARQVVDRGYGIANHSLTHSTYVPSRIAGEIGPANDAISSVVGTKPVLFRSPGLTRGAVIQDRLTELGMCNIFTSSNLNDWVAPRILSTQIAANLSRSLQAGQIILIHDGGSHQQTIDAVPLLLNVIRAKGFEIVKLEELLATDRIRREQRLYEVTRAEIAAEIMADVETADEIIDPVVELTTYLELSAHLSVNRRAQVETAIATAREARPAGG